MSSLFSCTNVILTSRIIIKLQAFISHRLHYIWGAWSELSKDGEKSPLTSCSRPVSLLGYSSDGKMAIYFKMFFSADQEGSWLTTCRNTLEKEIEAKWLQPEEILQPTSLASYSCRTLKGPGGRTI